MKGDIVCTKCETIGVSKKLYNGSFAGELFAWLGCIIIAPFTFGISLIVALSYSLSRIMNKKKSCPECGSLDVVPVGSPKGKEIIKKLGYEEE